MDKIVTCRIQLYILKFLETKPDLKYIIFVLKTSSFYKFKSKKS